MLLGNVFQKFGNELERHQQILLSLSDILIEIYFAESALCRTLKNIDNQGIESQKTQKNMVQFYVFEAYNIIHKSARETILSISEGKEQEQLVNILNEKCTYTHYPNIFEIKTKIADSFIKENKYFI